MIAKTDFEKAVLREAELNAQISQARFKPSDPKAEKPADAVAAFMDDVTRNVQKTMPTARFVKSKRAIRIDRGDLSFLYPFKSSNKNTAGVTIRLAPYAEVQSKALKRWRKGSRDPRNLKGDRQSFWRDSGVIVYGMLGNLSDRSDLYLIELAEPESRPNLAADAAKRIESVDEKLFTALTDLGSLISYASGDENSVACASDHVCEYIASRWGLDAVKQYVDELIAKTPNGQALLSKRISDYLVTENSRSLSDTFRLTGVARFYLANDIQAP